MRSLCFILLICCGATANAATLEVGPGKRFDRIEPAVAAANPGDVIEVYPRRNDLAYERVALSVNKPRLTIRAAGVPAGERVTLSGKGFEYSGRGSVPRAIVQFNRGAEFGLLEGFELTGASNRTNNGAGVRINQANHVTVRDCDIHDNDVGIFSNGDGTLKTAVDQRIERSAIHHNHGHGLSGFNHNLYLGGTSVTLSFCEVHHSGHGNNIKTRTHFTRIEYSYVHDSTNRDFDLVDGRETAWPDSHAVLIGNIIVKNPQSTGNRTVIHFGQDGGREHNGTLYLAHNTIVTPFVSAVVDLSSGKARAVLLENIIDDGGRRRNNQTVGRAQRGGASLQNITGSGNWFAPGFASRLGQTGLDGSRNIIADRSLRLYVDPSRHDYGLREAWPEIVGTGRSLDRLRLPRTPGAASAASPLRWQYDHPLGGKTRTKFERPDLGAHEFPRP